MGLPNWIVEKGRWLLFDTGSGHVVWDGQTRALMPNLRLKGNAVFASGSSLLLHAPEEGAESSMTRWDLEGQKQVSLKGPQPPQQQQYDSLRVPPRPVAHGDITRAPGISPRRPPRYHEVARVISRSAGNIAVALAPGDEGSCPLVACAGAAVIGGELRKLASRALCILEELARRRNEGVRFCRGLRDLRPGGAVAGYLVRPTATEHL